MGSNLIDLIEQDINNYHSIDELRETFVKNGYLEKDIDEAIQKLTKSATKITHLKGDTVKIFSIKEILDRIGYGFVSHQYINILFFLILPSYWILGMLNGLKTILSILLSSFVQEYSKVHDIDKETMSKSGIVFGFSFFVMAVAIRLKNPWLFAVALIVGVVGVVSYGDLYSKLLKEYLPKEKLGHFLARVSYYGILITGVGMIVSGWLLDKYPFKGTESILLYGAKYPLLGYLIAFEISALAFILSGYFINFLPYKQEKRYKLTKFVPEYFKVIKEQSKVITQNRFVLLMITLSVMIGIVQILGNSYYGVFIYNTFKSTGLGGFMNVAVIYAAALLVSFLGPVLTKKIERTIGLAPMIVFGVLLMALMPLTIVYNPNLVAIGVANALSIVGATIFGIAQGLLAQKLMNDTQRKKFYEILSVVSIIPIVIFVPLGAFVADLMGLTTLFTILALVLVFLVAPFGLMLVNKSGRKHKY